MGLNYGKQSITEDDIQAVVDVLRSDYLTQGPQVTAFENALATYTGAKYAVAVANGTAALHLAVAALELPAKSIGITSPITFLASANCLLYNNLEVNFADVDYATANINPSEIEKKISEKTRVIIPVHFAGRACDMPQIKAIADGGNAYIIEDAAHAIGSQYQDGQKVGSCAYAEMTTFSFHPVKTITTGEGGAITTNNPALYEKLKSLRSHGLVKENWRYPDNVAPWYYEMQSLGFNFRLTDIQAALGLSQLRKLDKFIARRQEIVEYYNSELSNTGWIQTPPKALSPTAFHLYVIRIDLERLGKSRSQVMNALKEQGIGTQVHYIPLYRQPYYQDHCHYKEQDFPQAEKYYAQALSLPLYPDLRDTEVDYIIEKVRGLNER